MNSAIVDTTILVDCLLKSGEKASKARNALSKYSQTDLPAYAIKEFRDGALNYCIWLYNRFILCESHAQVIRAITKIFMQKNRQATALEAYESICEDASIAQYTIGDLEKKYGSEANYQKALYDEHKIALEGLILKAWKRRRSITTHIVHELECFKEKDPLLKKDGTYNLLPLGCNKEGLCCLAQHMKADNATIEKMKNALPEGASKRETLNRRKALKKLHKTKLGRLSAINSDDCRAIGDAAFSFYCEANQVILTTNIVDHEPLAHALGRKVNSP